MEKTRGPVATGATGTVVEVILLGCLMGKGGYSKRGIAIEVRFANLESWNENRECVLETLNLRRIHTRILVERNTALTLKSVVRPLCLQPAISFALSNHALWCWNGGLTGRREGVLYLGSACLTGRGRAYTKKRKHTRMTRFELNPCFVDG
jgi:hypothetical protein